VNCSSNNNNSRFRRQDVEMAMAIITTLDGHLMIIITTAMLGVVAVEMTTDVITISGIPVDVAVQKTDEVVVNKY
jgi:hypothetical protein